MSAFQRIMPALRPTADLMSQSDKFRHSTTVDRPVMLRGSPPMFEVSLTTRLRRSPFFAATVAAGVRALSLYNQMLMPTGFGDPEAEYWRLIEGVSQWDVAVQRQVQITGPDAGRLAQILSPRDLTECAVGQAKYVALCNHARALWNLADEAGRPWDIGPGSPHPVERVESGLLACGGGTGDATSPFEVRLGKYVDLAVADDVVGIQALRRIHGEGPARRQLGIMLDGERIPATLTELPFL
jgi:glycine cleavage system aminomethyltransferase T